MTRFVLHNIAGVLFLAGIPALAVTAMIMFGA